MVRFSTIVGAGVVIGGFLLARDILTDDRIVLAKEHFEETEDALFEEFEGNTPDEVAQFHRAETEARARAWWPQIDETVQESIADDYGDPDAFYTQLDDDVATGELSTQEMAVQSKEYLLVLLWAVEVSIADDGDILSGPLKILIGGLGFGLGAGITWLGRRPLVSVFRHIDGWIRAEGQEGFETAFADVIEAMEQNPFALAVDPNLVLDQPEVDAVAPDPEPAPDAPVDEPVADPFPVSDALDLMPDAVAQSVTSWMALPVGAAIVVGHGAADILEIVSDQPAEWWLANLVILAATILVIAAAAKFTLATGGLGAPAAGAAVGAWGLVIGVSFLSIGTIAEEHLPDIESEFAIV